MKNKQYIWNYCICFS